MEHKSGIAGFYDRISPFYDQMMNRRTRLEGQVQLLGGFVRAQGIKTAIDAGCGTGVQTLALAKNGVAALGLDLSAAMVRQARSLSRREPGIPAEFQPIWRTGSFARAASLAAPVFPQGTDALFCLGNSIPHVSTKAALDKVLQSFRSSLRPGGMVVLQWLNYPRIFASAAEGFKPVLAAQRLNKPDGSVEELVRYYDRLSGGRISFNLMHLVWDSPQAVQAASCQVHQVVQYPWTQAEMSEALARAGFESPEVMEELDGKPFDPASSATITMLARRPGV